MKEQNKKEKKYNNGFIRRLIIDYLHYFISFFIKHLEFCPSNLYHLIPISAQTVSYCYHSPSIMIKNAPNLLEAEKERAKIITQIPYA